MQRRSINLGASSGPLGFVSSRDKTVQKEKIRRDDIFDYKVSRWLPTFCLTSCNL